MKVLHVNFTDLSGRRFNGYDLIQQLDERGISAKQAVLTKRSASPRVVELLDLTGDQELHERIAQTETLHSMPGLLQPWGRLLFDLPEFREADLVHYHQIHNGVVSILDLPDLMRAKPSVWTIHDPWAFTGHCIYPMQCEGWFTGCDPCPHLERHFALEADCAGALWRTKRRVYSEIDPDLVFASHHMLDMCRQSPLTRHFCNVRVIPFGVDASAFSIAGDKAAARRALGIPEDDFVLLFRANSSEYKGTSCIIEALRRGPLSRPTTLLTLESVGLLGELDRDYRVKEFGWVDDTDLYARLLCACDVFLMPSTAEAFGMMAIEAMAASRPVVCFEGTAVPEVTHAPDCGVAVPMGDAMALRRAIESLAANPAERERRGALGSQIAQSAYSSERYLDRMVKLYEEALGRQAAGARSRAPLQQTAADSATG